ncbi:MAG: hypothetical protein Q9M40_03680 [Sulfurimonas sp.]|nr:hypothetical protein [Sulfurimonas sp.]
MIKISLLILLSIIFTSCVNKHGISAKYYSDCREYYDLQGYYHKECGEDDIITYKEMGEALKEKNQNQLAMFIKGE